MRQTLLLIVLALAATAALAQVIFRSEMPDGRIIYGDKPPPGAKETKQVPVSKPNIVAPVATPQESANAEAQFQNRTAAAAAAERVRNSERALEQAKANLESGRELQENDRTGIARKGGTQINENFAARVKALEDAVTAAQKNLDDARAAPVTPVAPGQPAPALK